MSPSSAVRSSHRAILQGFHTQPCVVRGAQPRSRGAGGILVSLYDLFVYIYNIMYKYTRYIRNQHYCIVFFLQFLSCPWDWFQCILCTYIYNNNNIYIIIYIYNRRKFRSQTSDNMERWKAEQGRGREKRKIRREKIRRERVRRQKIQMREKIGKSRNTVFFQWFVAPEGRKVGSLKRRARSQLATGAMKNCAPLWREAHFEVKSVKNWQSRTTFGSWDVKKVHAVVARSTFPSQNVQNTRGSDHFWKLQCRKVHAVVARSTFPSQNVQNTRGSDHFWKLRCRKSARRCGAKHISKSKCTKH